MTFKELAKKINSQQQQQTQYFDILRDKRFWIWDLQEHKLEDIKTEGNCCFNHIIGLPTKNREQKPLFYYEKLLYYSLLDNDYSNIFRYTYFIEKNKNELYKIALEQR